MNWKRGLTRIYVILWIVFAALGAYSAYTQSSTLYGQRFLADHYRRRHPNVKLEVLLDTLLAESERDRKSYDQRVLGLPPSIFGSERLYDVMSSPEYQHPGRAHAKIWGLWLLICGLAPAALYVLIAWIVKGFSK